MVASDCPTGDNMRPPVPLPAEPRASSEPSSSPQSPQNGEPSPVEITAKRLVEQQSERQKRRRKVGAGRGSSVKTSLWSTIAATVHGSNGKFKFTCATCGIEGAMNSTLSTSNVIVHYKIKHLALHNDLVSLNNSNATEVALTSRISQERRRNTRRRRNSDIQRYFTPSNGGGSSGLSALETVNIPAKVLQSVAIVMFSCFMEASSSQLASPVLQGFVDVFGGRIQFASKDMTEKTLFDTYAAVCRILRRSVTDARTGCITVDGWSAALGAPILGMTWHYIDKQWNMRCVPIATLNMGLASKTGQQLRYIMQEILEQNPIVGADDVCVHTGTSDNDAATALAVDLLTNYVGSVRCVVHTLALAVNDVFEHGTVWKLYLDHVNKVTTYFNHHQKAAQLLAQKQGEEGITKDRVHRLKHDIPTRWHSRLAAMSVYLCRIHNISEVAEELEISSEHLPTLSEDQQDVLAEFITVLAEVRRVARELEADRKVTMSRAPRLLRELHETLMIMASAMLPAQSMEYTESVPALTFEDTNDLFEVYALPTRPSSAPADKKRDEARQIRLTRNQPKSLAVKLADRIAFRLGAVWERVDEEAAHWRPNTDQESEPDKDLHEARRVLLFHVAAIMDVNECCLDFLDCSENDRKAYKKVLFSAVVREAVELESSLAPRAERLEVVFGLLHDEMREVLEEKCRRDPSAALLFWEQANQTSTMISPVPFNTIARAALSSQASSAPAERLFSDLGRREGNQSQSLLSSTLEMSEMIRVFVCNELKNAPLHQNGLMHPKGDAFRRLVRVVAHEIVKE